MRQVFVESGCRGTVFGFATPLAASGRGCVERTWDDQYIGYGARVGTHATVGPLSPRSIG